MVTIIYLVHNRLEYTKMSLPIIVREVKQSKLVDQLIIFDDNSDQHTANYIESFKLKKKLKERYRYIFENKGNTTWQINWCIANCKSKYIYKIDNDILIPEGAIEILFKAIDCRKKLSFLMMKEVAGLPHVRKLAVKNASHIGGVGMFRMSTLREKGLITSSGTYFGFTRYQEEAIRDMKVTAGIMKGCGNTNLDMSEWSRVDEYTKKGWSRNLGKKENTIYRKY